MIAEVNDPRAWNANDPRNPCACGNAKPGYYTEDQCVECWNWINNQSYRDMILIRNDITKACKFLGRRERDNAGNIQKVAC